MKTSEYWVKELGLLPHPEGGFFKEIYRSEEIIKKEHLPERFPGDRNFKTSIYYLIKNGFISKFHRIKSDELWHFYYGSPVTIYVIDDKGNRKDIAMGSDPDKGETFQAVVKAGEWFGAEVKEQNGYALAGCTVSPGFDFEDFEIGDRDALKKIFSQHSDLINKLT